MSDRLESPAGLPDDDGTLRRLGLHLYRTEHPSWGRKGGEGSLAERWLRLGEWIGRDAQARLVEKAWRCAERLKSLGALLLEGGGSAYPSLLRSLSDAPECLFVLGDPGALARPLLAVVGSRQASGYGRVVLERLVPALVGCGQVVVSGMARGVDALAHGETLRAGGVTVGINALGLDHLYPRRQRGLFRDILAGGGCIVSEMPPGTAARPWLFPRRNRLIAGCAWGVLVVEARLRSGSMITARLAGEYGREVMAVPGDVVRPGSEGTLALIRDGARPVCGPEDILGELPVWLLPPVGRHEGLAGRILDLLADGTVKGIDFLAAESRMPVQKLLPVVTGLMLEGTVVCEQGGYRRKR